MPEKLQNHQLDEKSFTPENLNENDLQRFTDLQKDVYELDELKQGYRSEEDSERRKKIQNRRNTLLEKIVGDLPIVDRILKYGDEAKIWEVNSLLWDIQLGCSDKKKRRELFLYSSKIIFGNAEILQQRDFKSSVILLNCLLEQSFSSNKLLSMKENEAIILAILRSFKNNLLDLKESDLKTKNHFFRLLDGVKHQKKISENDNYYFGAEFNQLLIEVYDKLISNNNLDGEAYGMTILYDEILSRAEFNDTIAREKAIKTMREKCGVSYDDYAKLHSAWQVSCHENKTEIKHYTVHNIVSMLRIEKENPGIIKKNMEQFGIMDFDRYPKEMLIDQIKEIENNDLPYGIIIFPRNDFNGAFYNDKEPFAELYKKLKNRCLIRIFECEDKIDIAKVFGKLKKRYRNKISFAIIGGHGTEDSIKFGGDDPKHILYLKDFYQTSLKKVDNKEKATKKFIPISTTGDESKELADLRMASKKQSFIDNPTIILASCSTGVESGIAEKLSKVLNAKVIAPNTDTNINAINVEMKDGRLDFSVDYSANNSETHYSMGEKIKKQL